MLHYKIKEHILQFKRPAKTSRNVFKERKIWLIELSDPMTGKTGIGEAAPLSLLSIDDVEDYASILEKYVQLLAEGKTLQELELLKFPSIHFGLETALLSLRSENNKLFDTPFTNGRQKIPINGLVWMSDLDQMYTEALQKIDAGFNCIKFKVGAHDFDSECRLIEKIRRQYNAFKLEIRLDANGAFIADEAEEQLRELKRFEIHSIEQPIATDQWDEMAKLCHKPLIHIALDEELIGRAPAIEGSNMLGQIQPQYIILKPNLIGGLRAADEWIKLAGELGIGWWATSALESNVGLNAIAQWVSTYDTELHQGLGTGSLYENNLETNLRLDSGFMEYLPSVQ